MTQLQSTESRIDQLSRVRMMAEGDDKWDLSPNDCAALRRVLEDRYLLKNALEQVIASARPNEREQPVMAAAWEHAGAVLETVNGK